MIPRHPAMGLVKQVPPVHDLATDFGGTIEVSPARSVSSDTQVTVNTSFLGLVSRMKAEIAEFLRRELSNTMKDVVRRSDVEYPMEVFKFTSLHTIEDWCLERMRQMMGLATTTTYAVTVDEFLKRYRPIGMQTSYIKDLKYSATRNTVIGIIHPPYNDSQNIRKMWNMKTWLNEQEQRKYHSLMQFGTGETKVVSWKHYVKTLFIVPLILL